ncbi:Cell wall-associated hydrolase, NlpC family [Amycolatopsis arida]|uniref:Cell wall-associated hydrolase, NlpC family n=1 Tax=Amycolatopsis arida TaxID=587909 RepID=A0A1I5P830_9PSEU|nr:NlpC/P60 family protein [Amycolatopsis arida]TDX98382.1 cell wall-associated NlpC family hydrolase [Amycolatopsis arida]SFP29691.1 Cell wall-associated hydrolase, NlpC family [Amycolatopsis arida]
MTEERDAEPASRAPGARRRLLFSLLTVVVVAGAFLVAQRLAPAPPEPSSTPAAHQPPAPVTTAPAAPSEVPRKEEGPRFEAWVDEVAEWLDIPRRAMHAYAGATVALGEEMPDCHLSWVTLAGLGKITTDHGRVGGELDEDGRPGDPIGTVEMKDFSGATISVRGSAGPLQLSPAVWQRWGRGASGGEPDVQDIDDAALAAGHALCAEGRDLARGDDWLAGVATLHPAPLFLHRVLATANVYGTVGQNPEPPNPAALRAVSFAIDKIGLPYVWGGNGQEKGDAGFDCSGLTTAAYASAGIELLRTAHWQYNSVPLVPPDEEPRLGDLVFYGNPATKIHHVGLYIGNQQMVDAPTFGQAVQVHPYRKPNDDYAGAGRPAH